MAKLHRYYTGVCFPADPTTLSKHLSRWKSFSGRGFKIEFEPCHISDETRRAEIKQTPQRFRHNLQPPEVQILAPSQHRAGHVAALLYAAIAVIEGRLPGFDFIGWDPFEAEPFDVMCRRPMPFKLVTPSAVEMAALAVRFSRQTRLSDAALFFLASLYLVTMDLQWLHRGPYAPQLPKEPHRTQRIWEVQALFAAYQVIECLDVAVKGAKSDRPSVTNGQWNPKIRSNLESRLAKIGIDATDKFIWHRRSPPTAIHRKLERRTSSERKRAPWATGTIRDEELPFVDAINRAQWLRSNVSAHRSGTYLRALHPMDTLNVQVLARALLLSAARFPLSG